jgi:hypothetical protein
MIIFIALAKMKLHIQCILGLLNIYAMVNGNNNGQKNKNKKD